ncbi:hypothetical protein OJF2_02200 [Aquisphaera giovannonii]|uniref:Uncharacterized protein n=1 Tax=Aquisphaera giovannonii TaxID=406548 RepID=A0A5B9VVE0_9BACT|nr:hypothetical protein [Aquisphaera giovannonii]QEH31755.1 hypothetical protein OJF2_02200 [Aquisphaera giovannonii]
MERNLTNDPADANVHLMHRVDTILVRAVVGARIGVHILQTPATLVVEAEFGGVARIEADPTSWTLAVAEPLAVGSHLPPERP